MSKKFIYTSVGLMVVVVIISLAGILLPGIVSRSPADSPQRTFSEASLRYIPLGDSYTIGLGVTVSARWPNMLVKHLHELGYPVVLEENPAVSGYTVSDAIELELPIIQQKKPDLVTVFIGANDIFSRRPVQLFEEEFSQLLDEIQQALSDPSKIVLITIPDYSKTPGGSRYGAGLAAEQLTREYNQVIMEEGQKRNLPIADLFPLSQQLVGSEYYISDGIHPSEKGYKKWTDVILPRVEELLRK